jgi:hypothetical protein
MTPNSPDDLDRLLSDFFKAQMKNPWPHAPLAQSAEPSELATRTDAPRNEPAPARRDQTARAKFTLAASVALLLGTAFYMSDGYAPAARTGTQPAINAPSLFNGSDAKGTPGGVLDTISKDKHGVPPKVDPSQFE